MKESAIGLTLAFALISCGSSDSSAIGDVGGGDVVSSEFVSGELSSGESAELEPAPDTVQAPETTTIAETTTTTEASAPSTAPSTSSEAPPETTPETTPDSQPEVLALVDPLDFDGVVELIFEPRLRVHTAPGDPLNVRTGPGPQYEVVAELPDGTGGLESSAFHRLDSGAEWRYLTLAGDPLGWVNSDFVAEACISLSPLSPDDLIASVTSDVDFDGSADVVNLYYRDQIDTAADFFVEIELANQDVLSGVAFDAIERSWMESTADLRVGRLVHLPDDANSAQIMVTRNGREGSHQAFVLGIDGCDVVPTTLNGQPFSFSLGDNVVVTTATCDFDVHGEVSLSTQRVDWTALANVPELDGDAAEADYYTNGYSLGGDLQWLDLGERAWPYTEDSIPEPLNLSNCGFATASGSLPR